MKKILTLLASLACMVLVGCVQKYDDTDLNGKLDDLTGRVEKLEETVRNINNDITSLQDLVTRIESKIYVNKVEEIKGNDGQKGYRITFTDNTAAEFFNGRDASAPVIAAKKAGDGLYYWTVDGEFLLADGKKLPVKGQDGIAPKVRINAQTGEWEISTNQGASWETTGIQATGEKGDAFFQEIRDSKDHVDFILADGQVITVPKGSLFAIHLSETKIYLDAAQTLEVSYTLEGADKQCFVTAFANDGYTATVDEDAQVIAITAPDPACNSAVNVIYSNGVDQTVVARILIQDLSSISSLELYTDNGHTLQRVTDHLDCSYDYASRTYKTVVAVRSRADWKLQDNASAAKLFTPENGTMQGTANYKDDDASLPRFTLRFHAEQVPSVTDPDLPIEDVLNFIKTDGSGTVLLAQKVSVPAQNAWPKPAKAPLIANTYLYPMWKNRGTLPAVPNSLNNMSQFTFECLVNFGAFTGQIQSIMGIEDLFLARVYDGESLSTNQMEIVVRASNGEILHLNDWNLAFEEIGKWYHLAIAADLPGGSIRCYINGELISTFRDDFIGSVNFWTDYEEEYKLPHSFFIGRSFDNNRPFQGVMAEVRIWNKCLDAAEINAPNHFYIVEHPESEEHLLAYWKLNEGQGSEFKDWSKYGNNLKSPNPPAQWIPIIYE